MWAAQFVLRPVARAGDFAAGSAVAALVYLCWGTGVMIGTLARVVLILARVAAKGYRDGFGKEKS